MADRLFFEPASALELARAAALEQLKLGNPLDKLQRLELFDPHSHIKQRSTGKMVSDSALHAISGGLGGVVSM